MPDQPISDQATEPQATHPYVSFRTLLNLFDKMAGAGTPPRIDRSYLGGSEGSKTQVLSALRYFGLIDANGSVKETLTALVNEPDERPERIKAILHQYYPEAIALGKQNATQAQLEETFAGLSGSTRRKAVAFFLKAAEYAKVNLSPNFKPPRERGRPKGSRTKKKGSQSTMKDDSTPTHQAQSVTSTEDQQRSRYVELLIEKAEGAEELDVGLLDRIERLLGFPESEPLDEDTE